MVDFAEYGRQRCRNRNCQKKLSAPTTNDHHAFCRQWCHEAFYGARCLVCEKPLPPGSRSTRKLCRRPKCRSGYSQNRAFFDYRAQGSRIASELSKTPVKEGFLGGQKRDRASPNWRIVAGPQLTPPQLHRATVPDGPNRKWNDGKLERIGAGNRAALGEHFRKLAAKERAEIEANGEFTEPEWREVISLDGVQCFVTRFRDAPAVDATDLIATIPDDLSIPKFLQRNIAPNKRAAA